MGEQCVNHANPIPDLVNHLYGDYTTCSSLPITFLIHWEKCQMSPACSDLGRQHAFHQIVFPS